MDDEPKPKRRTAFRHALGGLALLMCIGASSWVLDCVGLLDVRSWCRQSRVWFMGRESMREQVFVGMEQKDVEARIGEGRPSNWIQFTAPVRPKAGLPRSSSPSEVQLTRVGYPEYGFDIVYTAPMSQIGEPDISWKVVAVEDRE